MAADSQEPQLLEQVMVVPEVPVANDLAVLDLSYRRAGDGEHPAGGRHPRKIMVVTAAHVPGDAKSLVRGANRVHQPLDVQSTHGCDVELLDRLDPVVDLPDCAVLVNDVVRVVRPDPLQVT